MDGNVIYGVFSKSLVSDVKTEPVTNSVTFAPLGSQGKVILYKTEYVNENYISRKMSWGMKEVIQHAATSDHPLIMVCSVDPRVIGYFLPKKMAELSLQGNTTILPVYEEKNGKKEYSLFTTEKLMDGSEGQYDLLSRILADFEKTSSPSQTLGITGIHQQKKRLEECFKPLKNTKITIPPSSDLELHYVLTK